MQKYSHDQTLLISYLMLFFCGVWGFHRFYLGRYFSGFLYLFTGGLCGLGILFDIFYTPLMVSEHMDELRTRGLA
ncbi:MAG TPA: TM2 domain-containing protein [Dehalococcoidia bacterium]|nr:TM2 domain-containing protein [Dehalococcoidia bacterium]